MHLRLCALAALALAGSAQAQGRPGACDGLAPDSFEASILNCEGATGRPAPPRVLDVLGEAPPPGAPLPVEDLRPIEGDSPALAPGLESDQVLRVVQGPEDATILPGAVTVVAAEVERDAARVLQVPVGQRPPSGLCRIWSPGRHAGLQRPPTACDVEVPEGAVLIRG